MSEDTGFPAPPWATNPPAAPAPVPAPEPPAGAVAGVEQAPADAPAETLPERVEHDAADVAEVAAEAAPFIPDAGVGEWLRDALLSLHRRLSNLEK